MIEKILHRLASAGLDGIKKAELKRKFGAKCDAILQNLLEKGDIFVEKRVTRILCGPKTTTSLICLKMIPRSNWS